MHEPKDYQCPFCKLLSNKELASKEIVLESPHSFCFMGLQGNVDSGPTFLIATKEHFENLYELPTEQLADAFQLAQKVAIYMKHAFEIDGTTIWQHNDPAGDQEVWHFHIHVKGRLKGDELYRKTRYPLTETARTQLIEKLKAVI